MRTFAFAFLSIAAAGTPLSASPVEKSKGERLICQRDTETGSLVKSTKRCYTRKQLDQIAEAARANGQRIQSDHAAGLKLSTE